jgi:hypothetical protein
LSVGTADRPRERQVMVMVCIMGSPEWGITEDDQDMNQENQYHNQRVLWLWGLALSGGDG